MPTIVQRVSNARAQGTRWRATPNAHRRKDQTVKISEKSEEGTSPEWLIFTAVKWISFSALQTSGGHPDAFFRFESSLMQGNELLQRYANHRGTQHQREDRQADQDHTHTAGNVTSGPKIQPTYTLGA